MLHVSLLGEQTINDASGTVRTRSSRTLTLLAFLVVHAGSPQTRQRIAASFWPDSTDEQALTNLRRELHHLRQALAGEPALVVTPRDLCWCDTDTCVVDLRVFYTERESARAAMAAGDQRRALEHAEYAVARYRGDLLPGAWDDWVLEARAEAEGHCVELHDLIRDSRAGAGDLGRAVEAARARLRLRPLEEVGYRTLIQLQGELGDRAGAVSTYHRCASVLERELGVEPDPATREVINRLLARASRPSASVPSALPPAAPPSGPPTSGRSGSAAPLVGRGGELDTLRGVWRRAARGRPSFVVVRGDAGVGKSRLVAEIADAARLGGAVVASTQCFGTAGRLALAPVADWLRDPAVRSATAQLEPVWRVEVDRLVPSGAPRADPGPHAMIETWQRHRFFEGLARALTGVGRPMLLVLDNLHWCDQETLSFLTFCLGLTADAPLLVAATLRDNGREPELEAWTARMRATGMWTELELGPLEVADTGRLAEAISGRTPTDEEANLLQAATGGFPLYVVEAARGAADVPAGGFPAGDLTAVLRNRLEQVGDQAREVAGLAAAVGRNFTLDLLSEASDLDADSVVRAVDELWRRRLLRHSGDSYDFSHDLLREAAYAQVSPPRRWLLHRRVAQGLELLHADDPDAVSSQLAEQYALGGRIEQALDYYRRAAEVAAGRFAHAEAIRLSSEALAIVRTLPEGTARDRRELALLESVAAPLNAAYGYSSQRLRETLERALGLAESLELRDATLTSLVGLWMSQFVQGDTAAAHHTASRALALVPPDSALGGPAHFAYGGSATSLGRPAEAVRHFELAAVHSDVFSVLSVGSRADVHATAWSAHAHWLLGHDGQARARCGDAIALARTTDNPYVLAVALAYGGVTHQLQRDTLALGEVVGELRALCNRYGFAYYREWALVLDGWSRVDGSGAEQARQGVRNLSAQGAFARMPYWLSLLAEVHVRAGRASTARAILDAALTAGQAREDVWWMPEVMRLRAAHDDPPAAVARLRAAGALASAQGSVALLRRCTADLTSLGAPTDLGSGAPDRRSGGNAARPARS